ncbi:phospholipase A [Pedobacter sp. SD-b]|uniref:Phosphatidylcholine 1-acylhydrolase n=1 Tax=Pedobacter segetis TaxID=2793069 RepID=A0ABS1BES4_9SPHI|nr:phospholipase A [Pedobacter segetis]MBK0381359.1 phospholipase A [Pedobacter segetis]
MKNLLFYTFFILSSLNVFCQEAKNDRYTRRTLSQEWELDPADKKGTFRITSYKQTYVTAGRWSSSPNKQPYSENPDFSAASPVDYNAREAKFQLSLKIKAIQGLFWGSADVWVAYTQKAHWQIYNTNISRAFRELNYEPEVILNFPLDLNLFGFKVKMAGIAFNHQSNGKDLPLSRSWNRIIFNTGFEGKHWQLALRPWIRLKDEEDENPLIVNYIGKGEAVVRYGFKKHQFMFLATSPFDNWKRGSCQLNYLYPISGKLNAQIQLFNGYGETLVDYNHKQFTAGLGISFSEW